MKHLIPFLAFFLFSLSNLAAQPDKPVWDIGTKWTYEFIASPITSKVEYITNEIVDTITINGLKLYELDTDNVYTGIKYFYYEDGKVYNYQYGTVDLGTATPYLQLLYDFSNTTSYQTNYRPICDPNFNYDSLDYQTYVNTVDSITNYAMPDGSTRTMQHITNEVPRQILDGVGFMEGYLHHTHDWELGVYVCDDLGEFVKGIRCFENDSVLYNFKGYPCDTTWTLVSVDDWGKLSSLDLYPNPANGVVNIANFSQTVDYIIYNIQGIVLSRGTSTNGIIRLENDGVNIIHIISGIDSKVFKVYNACSGR